MPKYKIIINPSAGNGKGKHSTPLIEKWLDMVKLEYDLAYSEGFWHAADLAKQAALAGYDVVVAAGGDGTANEVINGLMEAKLSGEKTSALGVLCVGRGNDFAYSMGIPYDLEQACQTLAADQRRTIDIGRVIGGKYPQGRYFGNCVGVGFDAVGTIEVAKLPRLGGFLGYFLAVLKTIFLYYKGPMVRIEYNGQTITQSTLLVSIMNGIRLGGGFIMAPNAEPDDGLFDLLIADQVSRARIFSMIPHFMRGTQGTQPEIKTDRSAFISIKAVTGSLPAQTDGEILCVDGKELQVEILPRQLEIVYQPNRENL
jgi:diacylglycerol kinase (ATP)